MKNAIGLFFESLMLLFIVVFCSCGYSSVKINAHKTISVYAGSIEGLVMNEGTIYSPFERLSTNTLDFEWEMNPLEMMFLQTAQLSERNLFNNQFTRNAFYVFTTASAP